MNITLTKSQDLALEKLKQFVKSDEKYFRLTGYAGTGKSFTIAQFMQWLQKQNINFVAGSPTNKAVKNLVKLASETKVLFVTVNKFFELFKSQCLTLS